MTSARVPSQARAGPSRTRHRRLITHDGAKGGAERRHAPVRGSKRDDDRTACARRVRMRAAGIHFGSLYAKYLVATVYENVFKFIRL